MIISAFVRKQLIAFSIASVIGTIVLAVVFLRVPEALGWGRYDIHVDFAQGAGLYKGSQVNYRGTPVGKVTGIKLSKDAVAATLSIKNGSDIPADVRAEIHSVSAVGEQYVELVPTRSVSGASASVAARTLKAGDVIGEDRTSSPIEIGPVLDNVTRLVDSVPRQQLSELLGETSTALAGRDQDLQAILDGSDAFLRAANESFPKTQALLTDTDPLLKTLNGSGAHLESLSSHLASVTDQLRAGDKDLQALLASGPAFTDQTAGLVKDLGPILPGFLLPMNTVSGVLATYRDYIAQLLSDYPVVLSYLQSVTLPDVGMHAVRLSVANVNNPPECTTGFLPVDMWRMPEDVGPAYTPLSYCAAAKSDPRVVRGARNVPCPDDPARREPTPELCRNGR